jgi:hypothetical protein
MRTHGIRKWRMSGALVTHRGFRSVRSRSAAQGAGPTRINSISLDTLTGDPVGFGPSAFREGLFWRKARISRDQSSWRNQPFRACRSVCATCARCDASERVGRSPIRSEPHSRTRHPAPRSGRPGTYRLPPQATPWREVRQIRVQSWVHQINAKASTCTRKSPGSCGTGTVAFHCDGDPK